MKYLRILCAVILCGSGHLLKKDYFRGVLFFIGFISSLAIIYFGIQCDGALALILTMAGICCGVFVWSYSVVDIYLNNFLKKKKVVIDESLTDIYRRGLVFSLKRNYKSAEKMFALILAKNKRDADAVFQLANIYYKMGENKKAKKMINKYLRFDNKGKWEQEALSLQGENK